MLNPDKQTVADLKALLKTTIAAVHGVRPEGPNQLPQDGGQ
jgi:hypothetical protein